MKDTSKNCAIEGVSAPSAFTGRQRVGRFDRIEDILDPDAPPDDQPRSWCASELHTDPNRELEGRGER